VSFVAVTLCVASQRVFIVVYFVIDPVRKLLDTSSYGSTMCVQKWGRSSGFILSSLILFLSPYFSSLFGLLKDTSRLHTLKG
jgi:hypothetical protein